MHRVKYTQNIRVEMYATIYSNGVVSCSIDDERWIADGMMQIKVAVLIIDKTTYGKMARGFFYQ